ncbi:MAG: hypothetical protein ACI9EF_003630, partial [Pseudohongiellaceae bacterium]
QLNAQAARRVFREVSGPTLDLFVNGVKLTL